MSSSGRSSGPSVILVEEDGDSQLINVDVPFAYVEESLQKILHEVLAPYEQRGQIGRASCRERVSASV